MWNDFLLAAVMPVTNGVNEVWRGNENPKLMMNLVAAKAVASLWRRCDENGLFRSEWEEWDVAGVWLME